MNGRTVRKLLMKNRHSGKYASLTVRLPCPVSVPEKPVFDGLSESPFGGWWTSDNTVVHITSCTTGQDPHLKTRPAWEPVYFPECDSSAGSEVWTFWTGNRRTTGPDGPIWEPLDQDTVAQYRQYEEWYDGLFREGPDPVWNAFLRAGNAAKAFSILIEGPNLYIHYSVKPSYCSRKLRFSAMLAHAVRLAKQHKIPARVVGR